MEGKRIFEKSFGEQDNTWNVADMLIFDDETVGGYVVALFYDEKLADEYIEFKNKQIENGR